MAVLTASLLWLAPLVAVWAVSRRFPRGSHARLWARLWWFTLRERLRSIRRAALGQTYRGHRPAAGVRSQSGVDPYRPTVAERPVSHKPAREGVWVGNVFRPRAFEQQRLHR